MILHQTMTAAGAGSGGGTMRPSFVLAVIAFWFVVNITIQNLVHAVVKTGFRYPLWLTLSHMVFSYVGSLIFLKVSQSGTYDGGWGGCLVAGERGWYPKNTFWQFLQ